MKLLELKFKSGNGTPVTRAAITLEEYEAIRQAVLEEREACAEVCDRRALAADLEWHARHHPDASAERHEAEECSAAIRNRETP